MCRHQVHVACNSPSRPRCDTKFARKLDIMMMWQSETGSAAAQRKHDSERQARSHVEMIGIQPVLLIISMPIMTFLSALEIDTLGSSSSRLQTVAALGAKVAKP